MMDTLASLGHGFAVAFTPFNLLWSALGVTVGTAVGVLPGIGPALTVALLLPVTYGLEPTSAFIMFAGIYYGAMYGGSTTSILLNTPGESGSIVTAIDGNMMARKGRGAQALATAAIPAPSCRANLSAARSRPCRHNGARRRRAFRPPRTGRPPR
jgi:putative tricarboxylic transport membrane protein